jgi:hypothetical protein
MKVLRLAALMIAMSGAALFPIQAYGQQEVDPDHFDHPAAQAAQKAKPSVHHHAAGHVKLASHHHAGRGSHSSRNS